MYRQSVQFTLSLVVLLSALPLSALAQTTISVGRGDNLNSAIERARVLRAKKPSEPIVIRLSAGRHYLAAPLILTPAHSGTPAAPFEIRGATENATRLSGGRQLGKLKWKAWRHGIWRARVTGPSFSMLWRDDGRLMRARYPNFDANAVLLGGTSVEATSPQRVATWSNPAGGVIHALHNARWGGMQVPILGKKADGTLDLGVATGNNRTNKMGPSETDRFVENIFEELDAPGEWYFDRRGGLLYLMPTTEGRPPSAGFVASRFENIIEMRGTSSNPVHDVVLSNIHFENSEPSFLKATEPLLRSDWQFSRSGAVLIEGGERIVVRQSTFSELGGNAVVVSGYGRRVTVSENEISRIGGTAIAFVGRPSAVRSPLFEYHQGQPLEAIDRTPGPKGPDYPSDSLASDNLIHDIGQIDLQAAGVEISMAARVTVDHNSIYRVPRAGINISEGTWGGHRITNNDVFETVTVTGDHGAFNSWGRDRFWHPDRDEMNRRVTAEPGLPLLDVIEPILIQHNRFQCEHGWDIDLDDGSSNYIIEDNLMLSGGLKFREGFHRTARNNIMINNTFHPHVWFRDSGDVFERNIVLTGYQPILMEHWGKSVESNLLPNAAALARAQDIGIDKNSVAAAVEFVDPANGDFTVRPSAATEAIGFRNFSMTDFGVTSEHLRAKAEQPKTPKLVTGEEMASDTIHEAVGMTFKSVTTLGEQSAAGSAKPEGVLVLSVSRGSQAARAGLKPGDVILQILEDPYSPAETTANAAQFEGIYRGRKWRENINIEVSRNQTRQTLVLPTR